MKKLLLSFLLLFVVTALSAQEVKYNEKTYTVKGNKIFNQDKDVTQELTTEDKELIFSKAKEIDKKEKTQRTIEKKQEQAEKDQKKAEKKQKKAKKALKKQEQAQDKYLKTERDYNKTVKKYEKLKRKGKLSPEAEKNWLQKIEKQKSKLAKAKKKL